MFHASKNGIDTGELASYFTRAFLLMFRGKTT